MRITVNNLNKKYALNEVFLKKLILRILKLLNGRNGYGCDELEVVFLNDNAIRELNKKYRGKDRPTDVLSFGLGRIGGCSASTGEVLISSDTAFRNSKAFGTGFAEELVLCVTHGILHLRGYGDDTAEERRRMRKREEGILRRICGSENLSKVSTRR
jgi:probable rRNA maturation factor